MEKDHLHYHNKWALITGASAGIGKCYAETLAKKGAHLVLVARRQERLEALKQTLEKDGITVEILAADLSKPEAIGQITDFLSSRNIHIDILINNAGFGLPGGFSTTAWSDQRDFIELMVTSYCALAHALFTPMMERGFGRIINVASVAGLVPASAGHTLYGASKAFLISLSESLNAEGKANNVHASAVCPGFTWSEFHDVNGTREALNKLPAWMMLDAAFVVNKSLQAAERGRAVCVPGFQYKTITAIAGILPRNIMQALSERQMKKARRL